MELDHGGVLPQAGENKKNVFVNRDRVPIRQPRSVAVQTFFNVIRRRKLRVFAPWRQNERR
jgi:hypothetical protein